MFHPSPTHLTNLVHHIFPKPVSTGHNRKIIQHFFAQNLGKFLFPKNLGKNLVRPKFGEIFGKEFMEIFYTKNRDFSRVALNPHIISSIVDIFGLILKYTSV